MNIINVSSIYNNAQIQKQNGVNPVQKTDKIETEEVRNLSEKAKLIKEQIENGTYKIDLDATARSMLEEL